nr:uncharacterized protein LOC127295738 [Lolium perenne]
MQPPRRPAAAAPPPVASRHPSARRGDSARGRAPRSCSRRLSPDQGLILGHVCCAIALFTGWIGVVATTDGSESAAAALVSRGIGRNSSRRSTGAGNMLAGAQAGDALG